MIPTHNSEGFSIEWNPETDSVEWEGRNYVMNDNYKFLAWYSGWKQGKSNVVVLVYRHAHPIHQELERQGFIDAKNDPLGRDI